MSRADPHGLGAAGRRPSRPLGLRLVHGVVAVGSVLVVLVAIWIGTRSPEPPTTVIAQDSTTTSAETVPPATSTVASTTTTSASTTAAPTTAPPTSSTPTTIQRAPEGVAMATLRSAAPLADSPGGTGATLSSEDEVALTGEVSVVGGSTWYEIDTGQSTGWTPASALRIDGTDFAARPCGDIPSELPPTALAYQPGTADGEADGIAAIERHLSTACERLVVYLGERIGGPDATLSSAFPRGLSVVDLGGRIRIEMADRDIAVIPELGFATLPLDDGDALAIAAVRPDGRVAFNVDAGPARVNVAFLARPARIVVDMVRVSVELPGIGNGVVVNAHSLADARVAGDGTPILITGYARLLDGLGEVAFRVAPPDGGEPGSGRAIDAQFGGTVRAGSVFRSWYFYETPRVDGAWAEYRFTVAGLAPRVYEIFLGLGSQAPPDVTEPGIHQLLEVDEPG